MVNIFSIRNNSKSYRIWNCHGIYNQMKLDAIYQEDENYFKCLQDILTLWFSRKQKGRISNNIKHMKRYSITRWGSCFYNSITRWGSCFYISRSCDLFLLKQMLTAGTTALVKEMRGPYPTSLKQRYNFKTIGSKELRYLCIFNKVTMETL